jgi:tetratricopeptide (TPR) repeat protein
MFIYLILALSILALTIAVAGAVVGFVAFKRVHKDRKASLSIPAIAGKVTDLEAGLAALTAGSEPGLQTFAEFKAYLDKWYVPESEMEDKYASRDSLETDYVTKAELAESVSNAVTNYVPEPSMTDTSSLERKAERTTRALRKAFEYLQSLNTLTVGRLRAPIDEEIASLEAELAEVRKGLKPLEDAKRAAEKKVAEAKKMLLPDDPSDEQLEREIQAHIQGLNLKTRADKRKAEEDYELTRPDIVSMRKEKFDSAKQELDEATMVLSEYKATSNSDAAGRIAELRTQLATLEEAETALADLEKAVSISAPHRPLPPVPRPPSGAPSEPPMSIRPEEIVPDNGRDSAPDLGTLLKASLPPPRTPNI